jgi:hypothetical protein
MTMVAIQPSTVIDEVLDFLVSSPTPEQIIAFHASDSAQMRLRELLDRNRNSRLTDQENAELKEMSRIDHFFTLLKARAMIVINDPKASEV